MKNTPSLATLAVAIALRMAATRTDGSQAEADRTRVSG